MPQVPKAKVAGIAEPVRDSFRVLGLYVRGQIFLCVVLAVLYSLGCWLLRVPYWFVVGIAGGVTAVIPRVGSLIPLGLAALLLDFSEAPASRYLILLGGWLAIQILEFFVLVPRLVSRPLGLREWPTVAALLLGSLLFGPVGLLVAIPILAVAMVFWRYFRRT